MSGQALPDRYESARGQVQRVVVHVVARARHQAVGRFGLVPTPGGVGGVEAVVGLGLVLLGVPLASAAAAVVVWRVLTLWLPLAVSVVPFRRAAAASLGRAVLA